ncbi:MAG: 5'/3'-nucleotidase SurE [bacterium]
MRILVTNDDGINSPGIYALAQGLKAFGEVIVVAPFTEQSAVGHAITMQIPVRVTEIKRNGEFFGYAVDGTPADCMKMGVKNILRYQPDIVVSGVNNGANTAINIIYSGTVSAAREAAIMDIPALAVSVASHDVKDYSYAVKVAKMFTKLVAKNGLTPGTLLNINVPNLPENEIAGIKFTKQGKAKWDDVYEERKDPYGRNYYWLTGTLVEVDNELDLDQCAVRNKYVSVTPIHFDLTDYTTYETIKDWNLD